MNTNTNKIDASIKEKAEVKASTALMKNSAASDKMETDYTESQWLTFNKIKTKKKGGKQNVLHVAIASQQKGKTSYI